jgi:hypothetical protein
MRRETARGKAGCIDIAASPTRAASCLHQELRMFATSLGSSAVWSEATEKKGATREV